MRLVLALVYNAGFFLPIVGPHPWSLLARAMHEVRGLVSYAHVRPLRVVEPYGTFKEFSCLIKSRYLVGGQIFFLYNTVHPFGYGVFQGVPIVGHADGYGVFLQRSHVFGTAVLDAPVGMVCQPRMALWPHQKARERHPKGMEWLLRLQGGCNPVSQDPVGERIGDKAYVQRFRGGLPVGDVAYPQLVGLLGDQAPYPVWVLAEPVERHGGGYGPPTPSYQQAVVGKKGEQGIPAHLDLLLQQERFQKLIKLSAAHPWVRSPYQAHLLDDLELLPAHLLPTPVALVVCLPCDAK